MIYVKSFYLKLEKGTVQPVVQLLIYSEFNVQVLNYIMMPA